MVVASIGFKDDECFIPKEILEGRGASVKIASLNTGRAKSELGKEFEIDYAVDTIKPANFDAVVFVGGPGMVDLVREPSFVDLARDFYDAGKLVAAICVAPLILAKAGILEGKTATSWPDAATDLEEAGAEYTGKAVTQTEKIITANGPAAAKDFAMAIIKALS